MSELTEAIDSITALIAEYGQTRDEMVEVLTGPADGGLNADGYYEVTLPNGNKKLVASLALNGGSESANVAISQIREQLAADREERELLAVKDAISFVKLQTLFLRVLPAS